MAQKTNCDYHPSHQSSMATKPRFLILGGVGFIGRNLVQHLVDNDLASKVRI